MHHATRCFHPDQDIQPDSRHAEYKSGFLPRKHVFVVVLPSADLHKLDYDKQSLSFHIKTSFKPPWVKVWTIILLFASDRAINSTHFWTESSSLSGSLLDNVASGWVFTHFPVSFQGATQAEAVANTHSGPFPKTLRRKQTSDSLMRLFGNKRGGKLNKNIWKEAKSATNPCSFWQISYNMSVMWSFLMRNGVR